MNASKVTNTDVPIKKGDKWGMAFGTICTQPVFDELYISSEEYARGRIGEDWFWVDNNGNPTVNRNERFFAKMKLVAYETFEGPVVSKYENENGEFVEVEPLKTTNENPRDIEKRMIAEFKAKHNGRRPLANLKD